MPRLYLQMSGDKFGARRWCRAAFVLSKANVYFMRRQKWHGNLGCCTYLFFFLFRGKRNKSPPGGEEKIFLIKSAQGYILVLFKRYKQFHLQFYILFMEVGNRKTVLVRGIYLSQVMRTVYSQPDIVVKDFSTHKNREENLYV